MIVFYYKKKKKKKRACIKEKKPMKGNKSLRKRKWATAIFADCRLTLGTLAVVLTPANNSLRKRKWVTNIHGQNTFADCLLTRWTITVKKKRRKEKEREKKSTPFITFFLVTV